MKKKLTIVQIVGIFVAAILPLLDGMFLWITYTRFYNISKRNMSLYNLMTEQEIGAGPLVYWLFYITLAAMVVYCISVLFFENKVWNRKVVIALSVIIFLLGLLMIITASIHTDTFEWKGEVRYVAVSLGVLAYIELAVLITIPLIECYKQFKCKI